VSASYTGQSSPVRNPDATSVAAMTKRAWLLVAFNILVPGSAQVLAGNRKLGRFALRATLVFWGIAVIALLAWLFARAAVYALVTNSFVLVLGQVVLAFYAILWIVLTLDTLRLMRLIKLAPTARAFVAGLAVVVLVGTAGTAAYGAYVSGIARSTLEHVFASGGVVAPPINGRYNILLLGGDAGPDRTGLRPDSISVVSVDAKTGSSTIIGIPRNLERASFVAGSPLYGPYPHGYDCGDNCLISYLYTYGQEHPALYPNATKHGSLPGIEAMRDVVEGVLGITLQYYVLIDMKGFSALINALGGITLTVTERLPIEGGVDANGQPTHVKGWITPGVQRMDGYTALWYARSRHGTDDYDRMRRQRQVQSAILAQFEPANVLAKFQGVAKAGAEVVKTDIPQSMLGAFVELADKARGHKVAQLELVPPRVDVVNPDFADILAQVSAALALH
jgi:LCP family protein required for cell wall assembly